MKEWTRLPNESPKAFQAFEIYRDMGLARSIRKVAERLGKHPTALARLAKVHDWVRRANLFDAHVGERKAEETAKAIIEMHKRHAAAAQMFQDIALEPAKELKERIEKGTYPVYDDSFYDMKTRDLEDLTFKSFRMFREAADVERMARDGEERMSPPASRAEEITCSTHNSELMESDGEILEEKINEIPKDQQDSCSEDEADMAGERKDASEKFPARLKFVKRESTMIGLSRPES